MQKLAGSYASMGDRTHALPLYQRALTLFEKVKGPDHPDTASCMDALGVLYANMGDYARSLQLHERALTINEKVTGSDGFKTAVSLNNLAAVYSDMGDHTRALSLLQRALSLFEKVEGPDDPGVATSLENLAMVYKRMGDYPHALPLLQRSLEIQEKALGSDNLSTSISLADLGLVYTATGDYAHALPLLQRALAIQEKVEGPDHPDTAVSLNTLAAVYRAMKKYDTALQYYKRGLAAESRTLHNVFAVTSEAQKVRFVEYALESYLASLSLLQQHFATNDAAIHWGLELALQRKGIVLEAQARTQQSLAARLQGEALQTWQRLIQERSQLARLLLSGHRTQTLAPYRQAVDTLQSTIARSEEVLAQQSGLASQVFTQRQVTTQMLATRLPQDSALLECVRIRDWNEDKDQWAATSRYVVFLLTPENQVTLIDLGDASKIDVVIQEALNAITVPQWRQDLKVSTTKMDTALTALYELLLRPLEPALRGRTRVIISPDGDLNKVPFAALRTPDGHYVIEQRTVSYVASGRDLLRGENGESPTVDLLLVANPAFDDHAALKQAALDTDAVRAGDFSEQFGPLLGTAEEARIIPPLLSGKKQVLEQAAATEAAVRATQSPKVLHLATHGFFLKDEELTLLDPHSLFGGASDTKERGRGRTHTIGASLGSPPAAVNPMVRSGLALAGANHAKEISTGDDGILTALEVSGMNLYGTDLVTLSACETGLGDVQVGEGIYGLRRAFVLAGAKNLVMSLWAANDKITLNQMEAFYRGYGSGKTPAVALREAQLKTIASLREQTKASIGESLAPVKLWAPFIVQQTAENSVRETAADSSATPDSATSAETLGDGQDRGKGGMERLPTQETPQVEPVGVKVEQQDGVAGYHRWNLIVPLLAMLGLLILSRVRLSSVPPETRGTVPTIPEQGSPPLTPAAASRPVPYARFVCQQPGNGLPHEIALVHDDTVIGSGAECDVILRHPSIAPRHARVQWRKQGYVLCDLQSPTGTYINGRRITENLLKDGWRVRLGEIEFVFYEATSHV